MSRRAWIARVALVVATALGSSAAVLTFGRQPEPLPADSVSAARLAQATHRVRTLHLDLVDTSRPRQAHGDAPAAPERRLPTTVWFPAGGDPGPLVVYSHGYLSEHSGGTHLARHLAGRGMVVASADFPLTTMTAPGGPMLADVVNQPADVAFLITELLDRSAASTGPLSGTIDPERIAIAGVSLGGLTSTLLAWHPDLADPRIDAVVSIAGPLAIFEPRFFASRELPFLMVASHADAIVPYDANGGRTLDLVPGSTLVSLADGSHAGFSWRASWLRWLDNPDVLGCQAIERTLDLPADGDGGWSGVFGDEHEGIDPSQGSMPCSEPLVKHAMNPLAQHRLTVLAVDAFLDTVWGDDDARAEGWRYLREELPTVAPGVTVEGGPR